MTEIHEDTGQIDTSLFEEGIVLDNYFAGGRHGEVLSQVQGAVLDGVALIIMTGDEGSGKTMLCHMFEDKSPADCITVFFPRTVDSFDDVVGVIAERLGVDSDESADGRHRNGTLKKITAFLQSNSKKLVVIFDEAENIYLATLERIRKMLDRVSRLGGQMHIIFSGRTPFRENYDQLSICEFERNDELHFSLPPLTKAATKEYLRSCEQYSADFDGDTIFTNEVVADIFHLSGGNFRVTKALARQVAEGRGDDLSSAALEGAGVETDNEQQSRSREAVLQMLERGKDFFSELLDRGSKLIPQLWSRGQGLIKSTDRYRRFFPWVAAFCLLLPVMLWMFSGDDREYVERIAHEQDETVVQAVVEDERAEQIAREEDSAEQRPSAEVGQAVSDAEGEQSGPGDSEIAVEQPAAAAEEAVEAVESTEVVERVETVEGEEVVLEREKAAESETPVPAGEGEENTEQLTAVEETEERTQPPLEKEIVELQPSSSLKRKPEGASVASQRIIKVETRKEINKITPTTAQYGGQQLLRKRMDAADQWYRGDKDSLYTVQLMVLASKSAEENLIQMLSQDKYRQEAGNFFILKQKRGPGNFFVFYGEYPSIAMARLAQNSLPQFLRIHKPYAISIKGAVNKIR